MSNETTQDRLAKFFGFKTPGSQPGVMQMQAQAPPPPAYPSLYSTAQSPYPSGLITPSSSYQDVPPGLAPASATANTMVAPYRGNSMVAPNFYSSQNMQVQAPAPQAKPIYGKGFLKDDPQAQQVVPFVNKDRNPNQFKRCLGASAGLVDIAKSEERVIDAFKSQHEWNMQTQKNIDLLLKDKKIDVDNDIVLSEGMTFFKPTLRKTEKPSMYISNDPEAIKTYEEMFALFHKKGYPDSTAHTLATNKAKQVEESSDKRKSKLVANEPQAPAPKPHDPRAVLQSIMDFNKLLTDENKMAWARELDMLTPRTKKIKSHADAAYDRNMEVFGFMYFCKTTKRNPFTDISLAVQTDFDQFKADNGFPLGNDWDGGMA